MAASLSGLTGDDTIGQAGHGCALGAGRGALAPGGDGAAGCAGSFLAGAGCAASAPSGSTITASTTATAWDSSLQSLLSERTSREPSSLPASSTRCTSAR